MSLGISLAVQAGFSVLSAYTSSGWKVEPFTVKDNGKGPSGIIPNELNEKDQEQPSDPFLISDTLVEWLELLYQ